MSDRMRWRYGETNPVIAAVDAETVIEIGDLLYQEDNLAKPASDQTDALSEGSNQILFAENFLGPSMQRSRAGETDPIRVATTGVFQYDCPADTYYLGDMIGADENTAGNALLNQQVTKCASLPGRAIGRVARNEPLSATSILVDIRSRIMTGGVEGTSYST